MGAKLYADTTTKTLVITEAPDVNGFVTIDVRVDVWSDLIEDWESTLALRRFTFPLVAIGGQTISAGKLGTTYVLLDPWHMHPYEADHVLDINGNLFTEIATTQLVAPTVGNYTVTVNRNLSTLVEVVETGTSGLTPAESTALLSIATDQASLLSIVTGLSAMQLAEHITSPSLGRIVVRNPVTMQRWEADAWEDEARTRPYGTSDPSNIEVAENLVEVAWS